MSDSDTLGVMVILLCLVGSMFFSASETAITSLGDRQAQRMLDAGGRESRIISTWVRHPVRVLSTILVGNNVMNTVMGAVATAVAIRHLGGGPHDEYAVPLAVLVTTVLLLVFGEIMPKALGRIYSHRLALPVLAVLNVLGKILYPITWLLTRFTNLLIARAIRENNEDLFRRVTADEIDYLVRVGKKEGSIPEEQAALLQGIFRFENKIVRDIMVPRDRVTAIDLSWNVERVVEEGQRSGHSRLPVYEGDLDHIKGVLHIKQLVAKTGSRPTAVAPLVRPPMFVSESLLVQDLLRRFKERRVHLAVVVDDGGHMVGVVTLEDVLEQIVGQIFDESDVAPFGMAPGESPGVHVLDGQTSLTRVEELFDVEFDEFEGVTSVGDLLTRLAGQMPMAGSVIVWESIRFKVLAADDRHVIRVSVERIEQEEGEG